MTSTSLAAGLVIRGERFIRSRLTGLYIDKTQVLRVRVEDVKSQRLCGEREIL